MHISCQNDSLFVRGVLFDPQLTLIDSAQVFHWNLTGENQYDACINRKHIRLCAAPDGFVLKNAQQEDAAFWIDYFDLNTDYHQIAASCADYPIAHRAMNLLPGMRVLNQPPWETLISFILSANNNVSRIRQLVSKLTRICGTDGAFPSAEEIIMAGESALRAIGCGYRAPYLIGTSQMIADGFPLETLHTMSYSDAHRLLLTLPGVGDKVADCIQLFSTRHREAFPVDVWVERLMKAWFVPEANSKQAIRQAAHQMFGSNAGIVQQSLFHCARLGIIPIDQQKHGSEE